MKQWHLFAIFAHVLIAPHLSFSWAWPLVVLSAIVAVIEYKGNK